MNRILEALDYCKTLSEFNPKQFSFPAQKWQEYISSPLADEPAHYEEVSRKMSSVREHLASIQIPGGRVYNSKPHKAAYALHNLLSLISYRFSDNEIQLTPEESQLVAHMHTHRFFPFTDAQKTILYDKCFSSIFKMMDDYFEKQEGQPYSHSIPVVREGYASGTPDKYPLSQHFYPCVSDQSLEDMGNAFSESRLDLVIKSFYGSNFLVGNIRVWQYYGSDKATELGAHKDGLPPGTLKIMTFDGDVTPNHGCFEILADRKRKVKPGYKEKVIHKTIGNCPGVLVDANNSFHRGLLPKAGLKRNTIELTIMPFLEPSEKLYLDGGCCASAPWNPFELIHGNHSRTTNPESI